MSLRRRGAPPFGLTILPLPARPFRFAGPAGQALRHAGATREAEELRHRGVEALPQVDRRGQATRRMGRKEIGRDPLALPLDGILPTLATIASRDSEQARTRYLDGKRQLEAAAGSPVVVRGINAFMAEAASAPVKGSGGYFTLERVWCPRPRWRGKSSARSSRQATMSR